MRPIHVLTLLLACSACAREPEPAVIQRDPGERVTTFELKWSSAPEVAHVLNEVFVAGDLASLQVDGKPVPGVAPAAKQMGNCVADNIVARMRGRATKAFRYRDWGALATIGRHSAVAQLPRFKFSGFFAWWFWLLLHIFFLIGFRSRLIVLINWAWSYFTYDRAARIILGMTHERDFNGNEEKGSA